MSGSLRSVGALRVRRQRGRPGGAAGLVAAADLVKTINSVATEGALKAAVAIEQALCASGIDDPAMIAGALSVVAPGVLKAYAEDDLGPFARGIVSALRDKTVAG